MTFKPVSPLLRKSRLTSHHMSLSILLFVFLFLYPKTTQALYNNNTDTTTAGKTRTSSMEVNQILDGLLGKDPLRVEYDFEEPTAKDWSMFSGFKAGMGFGRKENILESNSLIVNSNLQYLLMDFYLSYADIDSNSLLFYLTADNYNYYETELSDNERIIMAQIQGKRQANEKASYGLNLEYVIQQYYDSLDASSDNDVSILHQHEIEISTFWNQQLEGFNGQLNLALIRNSIEETDDDYSAIAFKAELSKQYRLNSNVALFFESTNSYYDNLKTKHPDGTSVPGTRLETSKQEIGLKNRHIWSTDKSLKTLFELEYLVKQDNGPGYYNYNQLQVSGALTFQIDSWKIESSAESVNYDYDKQLTSDNETLQIWLLTLDCSIEKRISGRWSLKGEYEYQNSYSNDSEETYTTHLIMLTASLQI